MSATDTEIAWAAGLFEGEGCVIITTATPTGHPHVGLSLASTDFDVLEMFQRIVGFGGIHVKQKKVKPHHKQQYQWGCGTNRETVRIIQLLRPWLCTRRAARADEALATLEWTRSHCSKGHDKPLDGKGFTACSRPWLRARAVRLRTAASESRPVPARGWGRGRLTDEQVAEIVAATDLVPQTELGRRYGISQGLVSRIQCAARRAA